MPFAAKVSMTSEDVWTVAKVLQHGIDTNGLIVV